MKSLFFISCAVLVVLGFVLWFMPPRERDISERFPDRYNEYETMESLPSQSTRTTIFSTIEGVPPVAATMSYKVKSISQCVTLVDDDGYEVKCIFPSEVPLKEGEVVWWDVMDNKNTLYRGSQKEAVGRLLQEAARQRVAASQPEKAEKE